MVYNKRNAFTLIELLLVAFMITLVSAAIVPLATSTYRKLNEGTAEQMVYHLIARTRSNAITGKTAESIITFKNIVKGNFTEGIINVGVATYTMPSDYFFSDNKSFHFMVNGQVATSGTIIIKRKVGEKNSVTIKTITVK